MTATKIQPGDDLHLTSLMAPHSLNFVTGADRAALLAYGRDVFAAGLAGAAPAAVAPQGVRFFNAGTEGLEEHDTAEAAQAAAQEEIDIYRDEAADGWPEEVDSVCWGVILGKAVERPVKDAPFMAGILGSDMEPVDYVLEPVAAPALEAPAATGFGLDAEQLERLRTNGLKPEEISGAPDVQHARVRELLHWFARLATGHANPKWLSRHAMELAYYLGTEGTDRGLDIEAIKKASYLEGVNISAQDRGILERLGTIPAAAPQAPAAPAVDALDAARWRAATRDQNQVDAEVRIGGFVLMNDAADEAIDALIAAQAKEGGA